MKSQKITEKRKPETLPNLLPNREYLKYLSLGIEIAAGLCIPILLGYWLDQFLDTKPWLLIAGIFTGIIILFGIIYNIYKKTDQME